MAVLFTNLRRFFNMQAIELKKGMVFDDGGKLMLVLSANHHPTPNATGTSDSI